MLKPLFKSFMKLKPFTTSITRIVSFKAKTTSEYSIFTMCQERGLRTVYRFKHSCYLQLPETERMFMLLHRCIQDICILIFSFLRVPSPKLQTG